MAKCLCCQKFPIMRVLFLWFLIAFSFDCGLMSDVSDDPGYSNDDVLREEAFDDRKNPATVELSNCELMRECNNNGSSQHSKSPGALEYQRKSLNRPTDNSNDFMYIKKMKNSQQLSQNIEYDRSRSTLTDYDLNDEDYQLPRPRKRRPPEQYEYPLVSSSHPPQLIPRKLNLKKNINKNNDDGNPLSAAKQMSENSELKSLLKMQQISGFSLSEILQQRNLSLSDLLKGKKEVISALRASNSEEGEKNVVSDNRILITLTPPRIFYRSPENDKNKSQRNESENSEVKIMNMSTELPVSRTTINKSGDDGEIMEFSDFQKQSETSERIFDDVKKIQKEDDSVLNIHDMLTSTEFTPIISSRNETENMNAVMRNEDLRLPPVDVEYQNEEPMNNNDFIDNSNDKKISNELLAVNHRVLKPRNRIYEEILTGIEPDARAEIFDLLSSSVTADKIEELLKSRNMSLEELIALRQRGSSRLHLTQVENMKLELLGSKLPKDVSPDQVTNNQNVTNNREEYGENESTIINSDEFVENDEKSDKKSVNLVDLLSAFESLPFTVRTRPETSAENNNNDNQNLDNSVETVREIKESEVKCSPAPDYAFKILEDINKNVDITGEQNVKNIRDKVNGNSVDIANDDNGKMVSRIKSNMTASGIILGMIFLSFLLIFVGLKVRQKQNFTYENTFSRTAFQVPVVNSRKLSNSSSNAVMINVMATSTTKTEEEDAEDVNNGMYDDRSDIENDSLDADDRWDTIPKCMKSRN
ncbi:MATH and LRR domain-containing protein PFE0570w-like [Diachasmimorpha longicaudata]|uniref:MATH and LRR domain-containing protein PFE0570w-like n=1 Tax=Diachasmimorpha longicaudata TaxID=58733 RepID=UPI0030B8B872